MRVLVTGGAGYIGCHTVRKLNEAGYEVVVYDNLSRGHKKAIMDVPIIQGDIIDSDKIEQVITGYGISAIIHFAAHSQVGESFLEPQLYYTNNVVGAIKLLETALRLQVRYFVFSSSAAVYGEPKEVPIPETHCINPTNTYGQTKAMVEKVLADYSRAYGMKTVSLRYFNAAGAAPEGDLGEDHTPETHLIPLVLKTALGLRQGLTVFGDDYPTSDGSTVRDYIHVDDLARAHILALEALVDGIPSSAYNLGNGNGYSVLEVIKTAEQVIGRQIPYEIGARRTGDPAVLVASAEAALQELGWRPEYIDLKRVIESAWDWHRNHPYGYGK